MRRGTGRIGAGSLALALALAVATTTACTGPAPGTGSDAVGPSDRPPVVGLNISHPSDSVPDFLFANALRTYRLIEAPGRSAPPPVDANGDPRGDFQALLWDGNYLRQNTTGTYALRFTGRADVRLYNAPSELTGLAYDGATNTTTGTVRITGEGGTPILAFTQTRRSPADAPGTGLTGLQLMRPVRPGAAESYPATATFSDAIKALVGRFDVIRFMDYSATNGNMQRNWVDRRTPKETNQGGPPHTADQYGWQGLGGAWEYAIQLCNETRRHCYINVPELATDDYVRQLAKLFRYGSDADGRVYESAQADPVHPPLDPGLNLYVEYSNETWNWAFAQAQQNLAGARAAVAAGGTPLNYDGQAGAEPWTRYHAWRTVEMSKIFRSVFGDGQMMTRVRPLLEWQYGNAQDTARSELAFIDGYYNNGDGRYVADPHPVNWYLWGGGGAAYTTTNVTQGSADAVYNSGRKTDVVPATIAVDAAYTRTFGLRDVAYEGGFQVGGDTPSEEQSPINLDPRSRTMELDTQRRFTEAGGEILLYFMSSGRGSYPMANPDVFATDTPKLRAIDEIRANPRAAVTAGTPVPATIEGNRWTLNARGWGSPGGGAVTLEAGGLRWVSYLLRADAVAATVRLAGRATNAATVVVELDGREVSRFDLPAGATTFPALPVTLDAGQHGLRLRVVRGDVAIASVAVG